jgi:hypothetical protein
MHVAVQGPDPPSGSPRSDRTPSPGPRGGIEGPLLGRPRVQFEVPDSCTASAPGRPLTWPFDPVSCTGALHRRDGLAVHSARPC